ncbi:MAG TPA: U32 family peptidase [Gammaproteobacteria bacterium]
MRITAPISRVDEIAPLAAAGADELYCGVVPREWVARFGNAMVSRRIFGNLDSLAALQQAVDAAHAAGASLALALNAQHYAAAQLELLHELVAAYAEMGGDAVIVGDAALLATLGDLRGRVRVHVSSLAACRNREAAALYRELGADRVILPRTVNLAEACALATALPELEFEAFMLYDGCVFEEGACHTLHLPGQLGGPICLDRYSAEVRRVDGRPLPPAEAVRLAHNDACREQWLWHRFSCGFNVTPEGDPYGPCGLCALPTLAAGGVTAVKIAGREAPTARKLRSVALVARVREQWRRGVPLATLRDYAQGLRDARELCRSGYMCYYPEVLDEAPALRPAGSG